MINILIFRNNSGNICGVNVKGHSGYDVPGRDIVCSGVSAIIQTAVLGLTNVLGIEPIYSQEKGRADLKIPLGISDEKTIKTSIVLETMLLGLKSIELEYSKYMSIRERKVE